MPIFGVLSSNISRDTTVINFPPSSSSSIWDQDSVPVCTSDNNQRAARMCSDGDDGAIIVWIDYRNDPDGDMYAQLINSQGICQWNANGVAVCNVAKIYSVSDVCSDESGGVIVTWVDDRDDIYGQYDIYSQRSNSLGNVMWGSNGVLVSTNDTYQFRPVSCSDGLGGVIIAWNEMNSTSDTSSVLVQRIGAFGTLFWTPGGVLINRIYETKFIEPQICPDGNGGAIIAWDDWRSTGGDIYAQRINSYGAVQWTPNGKVVCSVDETQFYLKMCRDPHPTGAAFLAWVDCREFDTNNYDIYAQRIDLNGDTMWSSNGIPVCTHSKLEYLSVHIKLCVDYFNGLIITWEDDRETERKIFAQRLSSNGDIRWTTDGIRVCSASSAQTYPNLCPNGTDAIFFTWSDTRNRAYAQKIKIDGEIIGNSKGYLICDTGYPQGSSGICTSANGTVIAALVENRGSGQDIYAQRFDIEQYIPTPVNGINLEIIIITSSVIGGGVAITVATALFIRKKRRSS